jgi:hypothetical protein
LVRSQKNKRGNQKVLALFKHSENVGVKENAVVPEVIRQGHKPYDTQCYDQKKEDNTPNKIDSNNNR